MTNKSARKAWLCAALFITSSIAFSSDIKAVIDLNAVVAKSQEDVASYLGVPMACEDSKRGTKCRYEKGEVEIVFIDGFADWITVEGLDHVPFNNSAISYLSVDGGRPDFKNDFSMRWESVDGIMEITIFKGTSNSDYAYIKTKTK